MPLPPGLRSPALRLLFIVLCSAAFFFLLRSPGEAQEEDGFSSFLDAPTADRGARLYKTGGDSFTAHLKLNNFEEKPLPVRLVLLLDYEQTEFSLDGERKPSFDLIIPSRVEQDLSLTLTGHPEPIRCGRLAFQPDTDSH